MLLSKADLEQSAVPHPEIIEFLNKTEINLEPEGLSHESGRKKMKALGEAQHAIPLPAGFTQQYHEIPMRDGYMSRVKITRPSDDNDKGEPGPLIVLAFGGGFVRGTPDNLTRTARQLALLFKAIVVNIDYRLAPEYPFPYAQHDAVDSVSYIASHAEDAIFRSNPRKGFILGGISAGGALTGCLSRYFQQHSLPYPLTGQWLAMASLIGPANVPEEYKPYYLALQHSSDLPPPWFSAKMMSELKKLTKAPDTHELRYAICSQSDVRAQPRTYFQVDGMDPLRDDGLVYHEILQRAGVDTKIDFYPGCPHVHFAFVPGARVAREGNLDTLVGFGWLLGKSVEREEAAKLL